MSNFYRLEKLTDIDYISDFWIDKLNLEYIRSILSRHIFIVKVLLRF